MEKNTDPNIVYQYTVTSHTKVIVYKNRIVITEGNLFQLEDFARREIGNQNRHDTEERRRAQFARFNDRLRGR